MILHVAKLDKFIPPFIKFINDSFPRKEHEFFLSGDDDRYKLKYYQNVTFNRKGHILSIIYYFRLFPKLIVSKKVVIHGLFDNWLVVLLAFTPFLANKCYWVIWGSDLYQYERPKLKIKTKVKEFIRAFVIKRLGHLVTYIPGDVELARKWYESQGQYHECLMYLSNIVENDLFSKSGDGPKNKKTTNILVGNSADPSNNHFQILDALSHFKNEDIKVIVPLSYGDPDHARLVMEYGSNLLGEKFTALTYFMCIEDYRNFLSSIDIAIFNHRRQQGMGNTITLLGLGKTVYMRSDVSQYKLFAEMGIQVRSIENLSLQRLSEEVRRENISLVNEYFSLEKLKTQWSKIFAG